MTSPVHRSIEAVWRIESARIIATLARLLRDIDLAEEFAQEALVSALEHWPEAGVPGNPGAWLTATAKRRAIDHLRRGPMLERAHGELGADIEGEPMSGPEQDAVLAGEIGDDLLRLMFTACHPLLSTDAQVALTLRLLGGLSTDEIARAFLVPEPTIAQRIVRAKRTLAKERAAFEVPEKPERAERLESVLNVIYLIFNEGYAATAGDDWMRPALCDEALRLGRVLAELMPREAEVHGLVALMELQASRVKARVTATGAPILLLDQNRAIWDRLLIRRGLIALDRAERLGSAQGSYTLQAAIAACHARALRAEDTQWNVIAALYTALTTIAPSPVVQLNRAVAIGMAFGPALGLELADTLIDEPLLQHYHLLPAVRGDLLKKLGRFDEARMAFLRATELTRNARERQLLLARAEACVQISSEQSPHL